MFAKILGPAAILVIAAACTPEPAPELVTALAVGPATAVPLPPEAVASCRGEISADVQEFDTPTYNSAATLKVADQIMRNFEDGSRYAVRLRGYQVRYAFTGLFGNRAEARMICFYDAATGQVAYLGNLLLDPDGRVSRDLIVGTAASMYRKMSGKSRLDVLRDEIRM